MALTKAQIWRTRKGGTGRYVVQVGETIFHGALVGVQVGGGAATDGRVGNWDDVTAGTMLFLGVAQIHGEADGEESVTGDSADSATIEVDTSGLVLEKVTISGLNSERNVGDLVYASDENTFTTTATPGSSPVGVIDKFLSTSTGDVQLFSHLVARAFEGS